MRSLCNFVLLCSKGREQNHLEDKHLVKDTKQREWGDRKKKTISVFLTFNDRVAYSCMALVFACPWKVSQLFVETCSYLFIFFLGGSRLLEFEIWPTDWLFLPVVSKQQTQEYVIFVITFVLQIAFISGSLKIPA